VVVLKKTQLLLAAFAVVSTLSAGGYAQAANGLSSTVTQNASIGTVVAANAITGGDTVFKFDTSGAVTKVSGSGVRTSTGAGKAGIVTLTCTSNNCNTKSVTITITAAGVSGRGGVLSNITAKAGTVTGGPSSSVTLTLPHGFGGTGSNRTSVAVFVGANFPIKGDDTSGASSATSGFTVSASDASHDSTSISGTANATVQHGLSIATTQLNFGTIASSAIGGLVDYPAGTNVLSVPSDTKALGTHNLGTVTVSGEPGTAVSIGVSAGNLMNGSTVFATITPYISPGGTQFLGSAGPNGTGSKTFNIGGKFTLPAHAAAGTYSGTMQVTAQYN
jgi:hypothetical protein